jgi:hypothetical protein
MCVPFRPFPACATESGRLMRAGGNRGEFGAFTKQGHPKFMDTPATPALEPGELE